MITTEVLEIVVTATLGLAGLYLAHSLRRQVTLKITERRLDAYAALWQKMEIASPTRLRAWDYRPLTPKERETLYEEFVRWYYEDGNGMLLGGHTRNVYLCVKDNLICPDDQLQPPCIRPDAKLSAEERQRERGKLSIRQLSLLRTRMKADLAVYGRQYFGELKPADVALLAYCGEQLWRKPWGGIGVWWKRWLPDTA